MAYLYPLATFTLVMLGALCAFMGIERERDARKLHRSWHAVPQTAKEPSAR